MSCLHGQVADAVVTELDGESWSLEFTAMRAWRCRHKLDELTTLRVTVLPGPSSVETLTRGRDTEKYTTDIVIQKQVDPDDNTAVDALVALAEEIRAHFRSKNLSAGSRAMACVDPREFLPTSKAGISPDLLDNDRVFNCALRHHWQILGAPS